MQSQLESFGQFLERTLKEKGISINEFAKLLKLSSRNTLYRLIKNQSSFQKILELKGIISHSLKLDTLEMAAMEAAIEVTRVGLDNIETRQCLLQMLSHPQKSISNIPDVPITANNAHSSFTSLDEIIDKYASMKALEILVISASFPELMNLVAYFTKNNPHINISIKHIVQLSTNNASNIRSLTAILNTFAFANYAVYYNPELRIPNKNNASILSDCIMVKKTTKDNVVYTDVININGNLASASHISVIGGELYNFYLNQFDRMKQHCIPLTETLHEDNMIDNMLKSIEHYNKLEKSVPYYNLKPDIPSKMIEPNIFFSLFMDANFYGYPENHPKVQKIIEMMTQRHTLLWTNENCITTILSKKGLMDFIKSRKLCDHPPFVRAFTAEEVRDILLSILNKIERRPKNYNIHILKDNALAKHFMIAYYKNTSIAIDKVPSSYSSSHQTLYINSEPFLSIFDHFFENEIIQNYTLSKQESIQYITELLPLLNI